MTGAKQDVVCKIFGENLDTLARYAAKLGEIAGTVDGTKNIYIEPVTGMPQIIIEYNRATIAQYGLNINDINKVVNTGLAGQTAGLVYEGEKKFEIIVRLNGDQRKDIDDVKNLMIPTPQGTQIPLYLLANIQLKEGPNQIQREDAKRRIVVGFNVRGRDVQSIVEELQAKVDGKIKLPSGYYITYGGAFENLNAAKKRLGITVPVSLLLIFILLYFSFNSVKQALLIYSAIPLSAIGGIFALTLRGMPFSISAGVGFIALFGVAVLNGIVLVAEFNRLKNEGLTDLKKIVIMGTKIRLRPVLMTAFVASLGFLPMALSNGAGAEVQRPLATVVIGGLLIATLLTLFVLPILYILFEKGIFIKANKNSSARIVSVLVIIFFSFKIAVAQQPISLNTAIDSALKNNLTVKNEKLQSEYQKKLSAAKTDIPQTNISSEYGQINSIYKDTRFGINQSMSFPKVYLKQNALQNENYKTSIFNIAVKEAELKRDVSEVYYLIIFLKQKETILLQSDSVFAAFLDKANLRFSQGESNILEKITAETQRGQITIQLKQIQNDIEISLLQFQLLINTRNQFVPLTSNPKISLTATMDSALVSKHPSLQVLRQQKNISLLNTQLEKSKLLPEINLGYSNMSIKGIGSDNVFYTKATRFNSIQFGIGVPLFFGSKKAIINSSKTLELIAENNYNYGLQSLKSEYQKGLKTFEMQMKMVAYFENVALKNATIIIKTANQQYANGDINYLEWTMLINNSTNIQSDYCDALKQLNYGAIQLNYLTNNKN